MTAPAASGYLLDTTALTALPTSHQVSLLITITPHSHLPLYAPVTCLDVADRIRPGIARHIGRIPAIEPVDLTYAEVLDMRERTPRLAQDVAHVVRLAHPGPEWPAGLIVATGLPDLYDAFDFQIYPIAD
ncbi:MAG: hypothetical protein ACRDRI_13055 [Pseudonocardiaceae bacterium]